MLKLDALTQLKQLKSDIKASRDLQLGRVKGTGQKFGFVSLDSGRDVFLPPTEMLKVLPGDRIEVEIKKDDKNKTFAQVERLIESTNKVFFGKYVSKGPACFAEADFDGNARWIFIPPNKRGKAKVGDLLKCKLVQHPIKNGKPQAHILDNLGNEKEPGIEWTYSLAKHDVAETWGEKAQAQLAALDESALEPLMAARKDMTDKAFFTVDGERTTDMDDALLIEATDDGWLLQVAIADPEALVSTAPVLESDAIKRAGSLYAPGKVVAMLPEKISSDLCSLVEGKKRLAKVFSLNITSSGDVVSSEIELATICSQQKLSYAQASDNSDTVKPEIAAQLPLLESLAGALLEWRKNNSNVQTSRNEFYLELNAEQKIEAIKPKVSLPAHAWVEECMLVVNRSAANFLAKQSEHSLFIHHSGVRSDRVEALQKVLREKVPALNDVDLATLEGFTQAMKRLQESEELSSLKQVLLRQLDRTELTTEPLPHFGLGFDCYTTISSPLRKANDYLLHKQLRELLSNETVNAPTAKMIESLEEKQGEIRKAVYDIEQALKCEFIERQSGEFDAEVVRVFTTGMQVRLLDNGIEGTVLSRDIEGKCSFNQDLMQLKTSVGEFCLGKTIKVALKRVDWSKKQILMKLA